MYFSCVHSFAELPIIWVPPRVPSVNNCEDLGRLRILRNDDVARMEVGMCKDNFSIVWHFASIRIYNHRNVFACPVVPNWQFDCP